VKALVGGEPAVVAVPGIRRKLYCHPLLFTSKSRCWEAENSRADCLARRNWVQKEPALRLDSQVCGNCDMRGFVVMVMAETDSASLPLIPELRGLVDVAHRHLSRIFKVEHYYNRMSDMEMTIAQMSTVMQSMTDPVILTDTHHRVITQNSAAERFFKIPEQVSEGRVRAVELNNLLFSAALSSMAVAGGESSRDLTLVDPIEGEEMLFEAVCAPTFSRDGNRTGMVTVMRNVTDLRRASDELRANYEKLSMAEELVRQDRDRLNVIIENVGDPIVVCDSSARPVLMDPLAQELFGSDKDPASDPLRMRNEAKLDAYVTGFTFSFSDRESGPLVLHHPGSRAEIEYDARSGKIYDERGQVAFTVTVLRDLSAVRKVEQLKMERRMLEIEKFAATGRLAGTIAHEVNNPMEAIKNAIYLLADAVKPEAMPVYQILKEETERVARIVRQMLGLYRTTKQVGTVDVNSVLEDTLLLFSRQLERQGIHVDTKLGKVPTAVGSADQLRQVLSNLVVNAKDSMNDGGRLLARTRHIRGRRGSPEIVRILLADSGTGIAPAILDSIFEPFITTKGEKGTGLGLWIVKGIIENHGGKIRVRSQLGKGTVFKIDLPVVH
jgi:signal transduction histidine kinase